MSDRDLLPTSQIHGFGFVVEFRCEKNAFGTIVNVQKLPSGGPITPANDLARSFFNCLDAFANQSGYDVRGLRGKIVTRAIEVDREEENRIHAVLLPVRLTLD